MCNRSPARTERLVAAGGRGAADIAGAVRDADVVATMVPDSPDVRSVLANPGGVFENAPPGALIIDFSTSSGRTWRPRWPPRPAARGLPDARRAGVRRRTGRHRGRAVDHGGRRGGGLRGRGAGVRRGGQDHRARRARRVRPDGQGREPAHGGRPPRAAGRGHRVPRGLRGRHRGGAARAGRRPGRQYGAAAQGRRDAGPRFHPRLPHRAARQGHGHRHRRRTRGRRGDPTRRGRRAARRLAEGAGRRRR